MNEREPSVVLRTIAGLVVTCLVATSVQAQSLRVPLSAPEATSLDRYVAEPDPAYRWEVVATRQHGPLVVTTIDMTSEQWRSKDEVDRTEWRHWLTVIRPDVVRSDASLLFITGGDNIKTELPRLDPMLAEIAQKTGTIVAELRMVPNQPLSFADGKPRVEDDLIAYTWDKFLNGGDDQWLARYPMTKAAVRAMDTVQAFVQTAEGGRRALTRFVVSGGSKRGWTTWTTAIVDSRVVAIIPLVIDMLNLEPSFVHHYRAYGFWAPAVKDYEQAGIMEWMGSPRNRDLLKLVEPFEYRNRLTLPKYIVNSTGDQFFLPDSSQFYFRELKGEKYLRYVPNTDHSLRKSDAPESLLAYYDAIVRGAPRPAFDWTIAGDGTITVTSDTKPAKVLLWHASNPDARDFRLETLGPVWTASPVTPDAEDRYIARLPAPADGWIAYFVELTFETGGVAPLVFTTDVKVLPDRYDYPAPKPTRGVGPSAQQP
jgi:PhoPQ-activated pathogenicity-related protein